MGQGMGKSVPRPLQDLAEPEGATGFGSTRVSRGETALLSSPGFISSKSCLFALSGAGDGR